MMSSFDHSGRELTQRSPANRYESTHSAQYGIISASPAMTAQASVARFLILAGMIVFLLVNLWRLVSEWAGVKGDQLVA